MGERSLKVPPDVGSKDYYKVLGVPRNASPSRIKRAYRSLIKSCHPDVNSSPRAVEWTRELNEAYKALSDLESRAIIDLELNAKETTKEETRDTRFWHARPGSNSAKAHVFLSCERCRRSDSPLGASSVWHVFYRIEFSTPAPAERILCNRCRVRELLGFARAAVFFQWWGFWEWVWILDTMFRRAKKRRPAEDYHAIFLNGLGYQLYRAGCPVEAYEALMAVFNQDAATTAEQEIDYLRRHIRRVEARSFWKRFRELQLHPICYWSLAGAVSFFAVMLGMRALEAAEWW